MTTTPSEEAGVNTEHERRERRPLRLAFVMAGVAALLGVLLPTPSFAPGPTVSFGSPTAFPGGVQPESVAIGDFNGDGKLDLAVASFAQNRVSIALGLAGGGFIPPGPNSFSTVVGGNPNPNPIFLAVGDFNRDGKPDLAVVESNNDSVTILLNATTLPSPTTVTFSAPAVNYSVGSLPNGIAVGDLNGDGKLDLAVANVNGGVSILLGNGDGTFTAASGSPFAAGSIPQEVVIGDFDRDGKPDLAVANKFAGVSILKGNGDGTFQAPTTFAIAGTDLTRHLATGDVNHDGKLDLVVTDESSSGSVVVLLGNGNGTFTAATGSPFGGFSSNNLLTVTIGDLNGDGNPDLAVGNDGASILLGDGTGSFGAPSNFALGPPSPSPKSIAIGDFNRDGRPDLAVADESNTIVAVLLNTTTFTASGGFGAATDFGVGQGPTSVAIGDFNRDGIPDLAVTNYPDATVSILLGTGTGSFGAATNFPVGTFPNSVAIGDLNGDGIPDLVVANSGDNTVSMLLGTGTGAFGAAITIAVGASSTSVAIADLNRDGAADLVVVNRNDNTVSILFGDGMGAFNQPNIWPVGTGPVSVAIGDFNRDGIPDLAVANLNSNTVSILLGTGTGSFGAATDFPVGTFPVSVAIGDLNGDGIPDLAVANTSGLTASILLGTGTGSFGAAINFPVGWNQGGVAIGDLNGDGKLDLAMIASGGHPIVSILLNTGAPFINSISPTSGPIGTAVTIDGLNFGATQGTSTVTFNGTDAGAATSWSNTQIVVNVPSGATTGAVVVTLASGVASNTDKTFTVTAPAPTISSLFPTSGPVGTPVTINGSNFGATQGSSTVTFNGTNAGVATSWGDTQIVINVPSGATTGAVVVTVNSLASNTDKTFTVADFTIGASPGDRTVIKGNSAMYTVTLGSLNGFSTGVTLSVTSGLPTGATPNFFPNPKTPPGDSTLTITTNGTTPPGTYPLTIQGTGGGQTHTTGVNLTVVTTLSVSLLGAGSGIVTSSPAGITCPPTCVASFSGAPTVFLSVTPALGSNFIVWGGACSTGTCAITPLDSNRVVTATFNLQSDKPGTLTATEALGTARFSHTETLLPNGKVLIAGGGFASGPFFFPTVSAELYDPIARTFTATGSMNTARDGHTATLLPNGTVLIAGGAGLNTAERYDPAAGTFTAITGSTMGSSRQGHTATLLTSGPNAGKVLIAGGCTNSPCSSFTNTADLYNPTTNSFASAGTMVTARELHTATLLPNGNVLVAGGSNSSGSLQSAQLYDSAAGAWSGTALTMVSVRTNHTATLLISGPNAGKVLIAGGFDSGTAQAIKQAELFNPSDNSFTATPDMGTTRRFHTATLLPNGQVLVVGGATGSVTPVASTELYDPATNTWIPSFSMGTARWIHTATLLPNGQVLLAGGRGTGAGNDGLASAELYCPDLGPTPGTWTPVPPADVIRADLTMTLLSNGKVLLAGGFNTESLSSAVIFDPAGNGGAGSYTATGSMSNVRSQHTATRLPNGKVLVAGGDSTTTIFQSADLFDPAGNGGVGAFTPTGPMNTPRFLHTATLLPNGKVLITGGSNFGALTSAELYDPAAGTFTFTTGSMGTGRFIHAATLLPNGKVLITGGGDSAGSVAFSSTELFDPATGLFTPTGSMGTARRGHSATLLPNGKVLIAGGTNPTNPALASAELYDPQTGAFAPTGSMATARVFAAEPHTGIVLPNGRVLIAGGDSGSGSLDSAEVYDFVTGAFSPTAPMSTPRARPGAALLPNGKVLVGGNFNGLGVFEADLYSTTCCGPEISSISATSGEVGALITITGANFGAVQGGSTVSFNGTSATIAEWSDTQIVVIVPSGASPGSIALSVNGVSSNGSAAFTPVNVASIAVTPANPSINVGQSQQFTATATFSNASTRTLLAPGNVGAGFLHTCVVLFDGSVRCWGLNNRGQLGNGTTMSSTMPVTVTGITNAIQVAAGLEHTCALLGDGTVACWGDNSFGQLGNGTTTNSTTPVPVSGISTAISVRAGNFDANHACALLLDGTVRCWGSNNFGQLGNGTTTNSSIPVSVSGINGLTPATTAVDVSAGGSLNSGHTCAIMQNGSVLCWGKNSSGQLGNGGFVNSTTPVPVTGISTAVTTTLGSVAAGGHHTCARIQDGTVRCWGTNFAGQLGDGTTTQSSTPVTVSGVSSAILIAAGNLHSCVFLSDASVRCWGSNNAGQLGNGSFTDSSTPVTPTGSPTFGGGLTAGLFHTCGARADLTIQCWGNDGAGQLGNGTAAGISTTPVTVLGVNSTTSDHAGDAGNFHTCAVVAGGAVKCWGANFAGQLGNGTTADSSTPVMVAGISNATKVGAGQNHSCVVLSDGTVRCWGANFNGQLGDGTTTNSLTPVQVSGITTAMQVAAGSDHTCALLSDGTIKCWGANVNGQLGNGTTTNSLIPVPVTGISTATHITAGDDNTCAVISGGTVRCWGTNFSGQLGNGTNIDSPTPVQVSSITNATKVAAGAEHICALLSDQTVRCWGLNDEGMLGNGTFVDSNVPVAVSGIATAIKLGAGSYNSCATLSNGTVQCWGSNDVGQLLNGTFANSNLPVTIPGITTATGSVAVGGAHACTRLSDGTVQCWGANAVGMLGNGAVISYSKPVSVIGIAGASWNSGSPSIASIFGNGSATGLAPGQSTISAAYGGVTGSTTLTVSPQISFLSPTSGPVGTPVTINGSDFGGTQGTSTVTFNSQNAGAATSWDNGIIIINVPPGATTGPVVVTVNGAPSNGQTFMVTASGDFTISATPATGTAHQGGSTSYTVSLGKTGGFNVPVTLSVTAGLPAGAGANFIPNPQTPAGTSAMTVTTSPGTPLGTFTLTIQGTGGGKTHSTTVKVVVATNQPPAAQNGSATTPEDSLKVIALTATDNDSAALTFSIVTPPSHGSLSAITGGACASHVCTASVTYTPALNYNNTQGPESFTFRVKDEVTFSLAASVSINVTPVNDAPVIAPIANQTVNEGALLALTVSATDADGPTPLTLSATGLPNGATFNPGSGQFNWTPDSSQSGVYTVHFMATDGLGAVGSLDVTITVNDTLLDTDLDGVPDFMGGGTSGTPLDNCRFVYNPDQADQDGNGIGDACDTNPLNTSPPPAGHVDPQATVPPPPQPSGFAPSDPIIVTATVKFNAVTFPGNPATYFVLPPNFANVNLTVKDNLGHIVNPERIPESTPISVPDDLVEVAADGSSAPLTISIDLAQMYPHLPPGDFTVTADYFNGTKDPDRQSDGTCAAGATCSLIWMGTVPAASVAFTTTLSQTERVSVATSGTQGNGNSTTPAISYDGRFVAFASSATNLVPGDKNAKQDIFVRDRATGQTTRVSVVTGGAQANSTSSTPVISADGKFVAFASNATNLNGPDTTLSDIFVADWTTGSITTTRVSKAIGGVATNGNSTAPSISGNGALIAFQSAAKNLVTGDTGKNDVFVTDWHAGLTTRISVSPTGGQTNGDSSAPGFSADGRYVAYVSTATNIVPTKTGTKPDILLYDRNTNTTTWISKPAGTVQSNGNSSAPAISADGRFIAYLSTTTNLVNSGPAKTSTKADVLLHDRQTNTTTWVSKGLLGAQASNNSSIPKISADGRFVTFLSTATNLVSGDTNAKTDVFVYDQQTGQLKRVSVAADGTTQANGNSNNPTISGDGGFVAFDTTATNLSEKADTNKTTDVIVRANPLK